MTHTPLDVLLLADTVHDLPNTVYDYLNAFSQYSRHRIHHFNPVWMKRSRFLDLEAFDAVIIHFTVTITRQEYLSTAFREQLARFKGLKLLILQDDYRQVDHYAAVMREIGIDVLLTSVPSRYIAQVWTPRLPGVLVKSVIPGYVPDSLKGLNPPPIPDRPLDVVYRGRSIPYHLGRLAQEKVTIGKGFLAHSETYGLRCDIAWDEGSRIYGDKWYDFITSSRAMLGTESGASIVDFDGSIELRANAYLAEHPGASFEEVYEAILKPYDGVVMVNTIPPKAFETLALRTALILFTGEYSGILEPWKHYLPLEKDFSNLDEVVDRLRDDAAMIAMTERGYEEIVASGRWSYRALIGDIDALLEEARLASLGHAKPGKSGYHLARLEQTAVRVRYTWKRDLKRLIRKPN